MEIELKLTVEQVNIILGVLSEQPIRTGLGQLFGIIASQAQAQIPQQEETQEEETTVQ